MRYTLVLIGLLLPALGMAQENIALSGTATQISTYNASYPASQAINGSLEGNPALTKRQQSPWWRLDLGQVANIGTIEVWNDTRFTDRLANFYVMLADTPFPFDSVAQNLAHASFNIQVSGQAQRPTIIEVNQSGRYLNIQATTLNYLQVQEVRVFASTAPALPNIRIQATITPPTTNEDGSPLTDLGSLTLYLCDAPITSQSGNNRPPVLCSGELMTVDIPLDDLVQVVEFPQDPSGGTIYGVATATDLSGNVSMLSNVAQVSYMVSIPNPPQIDMNINLSPGQSASCQESGEVLECN